MSELVSLHVGGPSPWQGIAPAAKLAFMDLGSGASANLLVPSQLDQDYFPYTYARQALSALGSLSCGV